MVQITPFKLQMCHKSLEECLSKKIVIKILNLNLKIDSNHVIFESLEIQQQALVCSNEESF